MKGMNRPIHRRTANIAYIFKYIRIFSPIFFYRSENRIILSMTIPLNIGDVIQHFQGGWRPDFLGTSQRFQTINLINLTAWWFGTWLLFSISYMGCYPNSYFSEGLNHQPINIWEEDPHWFNACFFLNGLTPPMRPSRLSHCRFSMLQSSLERRFADKNSITHLGNDIG